MIEIIGCNKFTVGKSVVTVTVHGCLDCGVIEAESAIEAQNLMFRMGDRNYRIEFKRCPRCHSARYAEPSRTSDFNQATTEREQQIRGNR
jgi:hypothetical protein